MDITIHHFARALFKASRAGHVHVLERWANDSRALDVDRGRNRRMQHVLMDASDCGQLQVLKWWQEHGNFDFGVIPEWVVVQFVKQSVPPEMVFKGVGAVQAAAEGGRIKIMQRWKDNNVPFTLTEPYHDLDAIKSFVALTLIVKLR
ncbi:hypothetical protein BCR44DRAFT_1466077 [Catenaria anguillulae PL171]|uniref:Uncharacterized protein n=1 Tax=Catenaria anguillulae PL171 TaxID=765915 RepID=A0A1Y2H7F8_9FUNG|nr:hypothetical protein BCR44DRAFT_1466077 [Catenaria anguillulae PL171]